MKKLVLIVLVLFSLPALAQEEKEEKKEPEKPLTLSLDELVVVGTRGERKLSTLSGAITVIGTGDIEASNALSVDELLATVPGIDVQGSSEPGKKVTLNIRGLQGRWGAQRVLVLVDGRPANEEYLGDFDFRFVPTEAIERIEVSKGPASALYGGLAIGGVINIITKDPRKKKEGSLCASVGTYDSHRYTATASTGGKTLGALTTASWYKTDGHPEDSMGTTHDWESGRFFGKVVRGYESGALLTFSSGSSYGTGHEEDFATHQVNDFQYLALSLHPGQRKEDQKLELRLFRNGTYRELRWSFGFDGRYHQYTAGAQAQHTFRLSKTNTLTTGVETKLQRANVGEMTGHVEENAYESSAYVQDEIELGRFKFTLGLRFDNGNKFNPQLSPRAGITYAPVKTTVFRVTGGKAFRPPTISDMYMPPVMYMGMIFEGNRELKPETLWSGEFGVRQKLRLAGREMSVDASVYRSRGTDFWDYMMASMGPPPTLHPLNVNAVSIFGGELEVSALLSKRLKATLGYTYTDARYATYEPDPSIEHNHVEDIPEHAGSAALAYRSPEGHTASVVLKVAGDRYTDPENYRDTKLHSFAVLSVGCKAKLSRNTAAFVRVDNLTDEKYRETETRLAPGRTFTAGMSLTF